MPPTASAPATAQPHRSTRAPAGCAVAPAHLLASRCAIAADTHPRHNEDRLLVAPALGLAGVFDGVGGSAAGEVAARLAAEAVARDWARVLEHWSAHNGHQPDPASRAALDLPRALDALLLRAHAHVRRGRPQAAARDRSTTAAVVAVLGLGGASPARLGYAWVGDSRIYLLPAHRRLRRLTQDDGVLTGLVHEGALSAPAALRIDQAVSADQLSAAEQLYFKMRNGITQALGDRTMPTVHVGETPLAPGDRILLCSDGISDNLTDAELEPIVRLATPASAAREIVGAAQASARRGHGVSLRAKHDDMSAIVLVCR